MLRREVAGARCERKQYLSHWLLAGYPRHMVSRGNIEACRVDKSDCQRYGIFNVLADNVDKYS